MMVSGTETGFQTGRDNAGFPMAPPIMVISSEEKETSMVA